jgi:hypothetical protein
MRRCPCFMYSRCQKQLFSFAAESWCFGRCARLSRRRHCAAPWQPRKVHLPILVEVTKRLAKSDSKRRVTEEPGQHITERFPTHLDWLFAKSCIRSLKATWPSCPTPRTILTVQSDSRRCQCSSRRFSHSPRPLQRRNLYIATPSIRHRYAFLRVQHGIVQSRHIVLDQTNNLFRQVSSRTTTLQYHLRHSYSLFPMYLSNNHHE